MGLLTDLLSAIDARKRVLASNLRDPVGAMGLLGGSLADERRRSKRETEEAARRAKGGGGLLGMSVMGGDRVTDMPEWEAAGLAPMGLLGAIKAYHGSPHKFDKFDMSKIGTGEGAQAYGHGLYFAESPEVAKTYASPLRESMSWTIDGERVHGMTTRSDATYKNLAANALDRFGGDKKKALKWLDEDLGGGQASEYLRKAKSIKPAETHLYETSLRWPDAREATDPLGPQHFLDWDKPLTAQPEPVRNALEKIGERPPLQELIDEAKAQMMEALQRNDSKAFGAAQRDWTLLAYPRTGKQMYQGFPSDSRASQVLRDAGIPGIRYLDGGSRAAGQGTANYVLFDDALIEILKRNGMTP